MEKPIHRGDTSETVLSKWIYFEYEEVTFQMRKEIKDYSINDNEMTCSFGRIKSPPHNLHWSKSLMI